MAMAVEATATDENEPMKSRAFWTLNVAKIVQKYTLAL